MSAPGSAFSSNGCAQVRSWTCPGVSIRLQGLPKASTSAWTLVVNPPRDLPIACAPFVSRTGAMLVSAHDGGVDHHVLVVVIAGQKLENTIENPALRPSAEELMDRFPMAETLGQIPPGTSSPKAIENRFDEQSIIFGGAAHVSFTPRQNVLDPLPLVVA